MCPLPTTHHDPPLQEFILGVMGCQWPRLAIVDGLISTFAAAMVKHEWLPASIGSLQLQLSDTLLIPGAILRGIVTLTIAERVESTVITVFIEGLQSLQWGAIGGRGSAAHLQKLSFKHLAVEDVLGQFNGYLAPGVHEFPFELRLPTHLLASTRIKRLLDKTPERLRQGWLDVAYSVSAKLEAAGLSSPSLQQTCPFEVLKVPTPLQLPQPIAVTHEDNVKPILGLGQVKPCTVIMQLLNATATVPAGLIEADVTILLPANLKLFHVHLVLYEDVVMNIDKNYADGGQQDARTVCRSTYSAKHFTTETGDSTMLRGRLQLQISDPEAKRYGSLVPSLRTRFLDINHRVGVECSFVMGSRVSISSPIVLVDEVATPA